jgi:O-antigen/teichoic acid export membrane protein
MDKAIEIGQTSAQGSLHLFLGQIISTILLAVGTIVLQLFILEKDYGLYAISLIPVTTFLLFQDWGVGAAMARQCAKCRAEKNLHVAREIIVSGLAFNVSTGLILTLISFFMSTSIALMINKPESAFLLSVASVLIFCNSLLVAPHSAFIGFERMDLYVITTICQASIQCLLAPLLVYLGYGALGALLGYAFGFLISGILSIALLYFAIIRKLGLTKNKIYIFKRTNLLRGMLRYGIPLAIGTILGGVLTQFYSFMMAKYVTDMAVIGNYRTATNFAVLITFISMPISTVLFPAFSKINPQKEKEILERVFKLAVKYTAFLLVPITILLMVLSPSLISAIYGGKWLLAPSFLSLYVTINIFAIFGNLAAFSLLTAVGDTKLMMKLFLLSLCIGIPLGFIAIPHFGIPGLIIANIVGGLPSMFIAVLTVSKRYGAKIDLWASIKILFASLAVGAITFVFLSVFQTFETLRLITGGLLFLILYLAITPLIGAINETDILNLRRVISQFGFIGKLLRIPLRIMENLSKNSPLVIKRKRILNLT